MMQRNWKTEPTTGRGNADTDNDYPYLHGPTRKLVSQMISVMRPGLWRARCRLNLPGHIDLRDISFTSSSDFLVKIPIAYLRPIRGKSWSSYYTDGEATPRGSNPELGSASRGRYASKHIDHETLGSMHSTTAIQCSPRGTCTSPATEPQYNSLHAISQANFGAACALVKLEEPHHRSNLFQG